MELKATKVTRQYHRKGKGTNLFTAVQETDLLVPAGKLIEIEGRSGSGKSTLLNMMAGILAPTSGRIELDGQDLYALQDAELSRLRNRRIGMIPQGQTGLSALTVLENVLLPTLLYPPDQTAPAVRTSADADPEADTPGKAVSEKTLRPADASNLTARAKELRSAGASNLTARAEDLLEQVGIAALRDARPDELSGGELRRLAVARALIMDPGIVLADEPTADLDDENTKTVLSLLRRCADEGRAVLLVTHEREAAAYADELYRMNNGVLTRAAGI